MKQNIVYKFHKSDIALDEQICINNSFDYLTDFQSKNSRNRRIKTEHNYLESCIIHIDVREQQLLNLERQLKDQFQDLQQYQCQLVQQQIKEKSYLNYFHSRFQKKSFEVHKQQNQINQLNNGTNSLSEYGIKQLMMYKIDHDNKLHLLKVRTNEKNNLNSKMQTTKLSISKLEDQLNLLKQKQKIVKSQLIEVLYGLLDYSTYSIIEIIRKIIHLNVLFDIKRFPKALDMFEKQYLIDKVNYEQAGKSTEQLDEMFIQKLRIKVKQLKIIRDNLEEYLTKLFGKEASTYLTMLPQIKKRSISMLRRLRKSANIY